MRKTIFAMGIIALFIGLAFIPAEAGAKTQVSKSVEQEKNILSDPEYTFHFAKIELTSGKYLAWGGAMWFWYPFIRLWINTPPQMFMVLGGKSDAGTKFELRQELAPGTITITQPGKTPLTISTNAIIRYDLFFGKITTGGEKWTDEHEIVHENLENYLNGRAFNIQVWLT